MTKKQSQTLIVTRTMDRPLLLERAIKSVLAQTNKNYTHVIINNGGNKKIFDTVLRKYSDKRRVVIQNDQPVGLSTGLNQAIQAVSSEYITILDDDDSWHPKKLEVITEYLDSTQEPGAVAYMDRIIERIDGTEIIEESRNRWHEGVDSVSLYQQCLDNYLSNGCFTYRRSVYDELQGYDESLDVAEDWDFGIRYMMRYDAHFVPSTEALVYYHHRPEQKGSEGNSVFAGAESHKRNLMVLRNRYLRDDLAKGVVGIGYIMNDLANSRYRDELRDKKNDQLVVRLEGHINHQSDRVIASSVVRTIHSKVKRYVSGK